MCHRNHRYAAAHGKQCPADLPREFACHRRIRYPIPERVEQWLMARLPENLGCTAGAVFCSGSFAIGSSGQRKDRELPTAPDMRSFDVSPPMVQSIRGGSYTARQSASASSGLRLSRFLIASLDSTTRRPCASNV